MAELNGEYQGVATNHPRIAEYTKKMIREGIPRDEIVKRIGMPAEVIQAYERDVKREDKERRSG